MVWSRKSLYPFPLVTLLLPKTRIVITPRSMLGPSPLYLLFPGIFERWHRAYLILDSPLVLVILFDSHSSPLIVTHKHLLAMFDQELHRPVLRLCILHFPRQTLWPHNGRRKYNRHVLARHQVVRLLFHDPRQMEYQHFQRITVMRR